MNALLYISSIIPLYKVSNVNEVMKDEMSEESTNINEPETLVSSTLSSLLIWKILFFLPNWILLKPIIFIWFIITFPLNLIERNPNEESTIVSTPTLSDGKPIIEEDMIGDEIILQKDSIKGSLSTSTMNKNLSFKQLPSSALGKFLFPKKLIPKSILQTNKKLLILDLDETLIHSMSRSTSSINNSQGHMVEVRFFNNDISTLYFVHKRPYCDFFLNQVSKWYDIMIFTASMKEYADPVIDWLESSMNEKFKDRFYRNDCILRDGVGYIKDLSTLGKQLSEIIIMDNSPISYAMHVDNAIQVEGWISDPTDTDLLNLLPLLESLRFTTDVRNVLSLKNGEKAFQG